MNAHQTTQTETTHDYTVLSAMKHIANFVKAGAITESYRREKIYEPIERD